MAYKSTEDWVKEYINNTQNKKRYNAELATLNASALANKAVIDEAANKNIANLEKDYAEDVTDTREAVADAREVNAIQRALNERNINERMANLGLSDSGYADVTRAGNEAAFENTATNLTRNEQKALDTLAATLRENKDALNLEREQDKAAVDIKLAEETTKLKNDFYKDAEKYAENMRELDRDAREDMFRLEQNYNKMVEDENGDKKPYWTDAQKNYYVTSYVEKYGLDRALAELPKNIFLAELTKDWGKYDWWKYMRSYAEKHSVKDSQDEYNEIVEYIPDEYRATVKSAIRMTHYGG